MKYRTTAKAIRANYEAVSLGYCEAQNLLRAVAEPEAYTCGVYGWNADIYRTTEPGKVIVTGYRPFGRKAALGYEAVRHYDRQAEAIMRDYRRPYEERRAEVEELFAEFSKLI